ncbi:MAG: hypothetical protein QXP55_05290 [Nitrososphaerales archaeon]
MVDEKEKIIISALLGLLLTLLIMSIFSPLSQEFTISFNAFSIILVSKEGLSESIFNQNIDITQPSLLYKLSSPTLINLTLTLIFALFLSSILFFCIKMKSK